MFFFNYTATTEIYPDRHTLSLHDALPICAGAAGARVRPQPDQHRADGDLRSAEDRRHGPAAGQPRQAAAGEPDRGSPRADHPRQRSEEHTSELQSLMRISYDDFSLKKKNTKRTKKTPNYKNTNNR